MPIFNDIFSGSIPTEVRAHILGINVSSLYGLSLGTLEFCLFIRIVLDKLKFDFGLFGPFLSLIVDCEADSFRPVILF